MLGGTPCFGESQYVAKRDEHVRTISISFVFTSKTIEEHRLLLTDAQRHQGKNDRHAQQTDTPVFRDEK